MEFFVSKSVIGFAAHPDDLEFTCTGTLFKLKKQGYEIIYVIVTKGENGFKGDLNISRKERVQIRTQEQLEVAGKLGVKDVVFLNYSDGFLIYTPCLRCI